VSVQQFDQGRRVSQARRLLDALVRDTRTVSRCVVALEGLPDDCSRWTPEQWAALRACSQQLAELTGRYRVGGGQ
jgi:hypothetical protein